MKIYCNRRDRNELDRFVGDDIWILCEVLRTARNTGEEYWSKIPAWIRIVSSDDNSYIVNLRLSAGKEGHDFVEPEMREHYLNKMHKKLKSQLRVIHPMQCYTTDEFFSGEEEDIDE